MPIVSLVITLFKESTDIIDRSINSVINQTYNDIEIILVLDDPDNQLLANHIRAHYSEYGNLIIIYNKNNLGAGAARNKGIDVASGDYMAFLDGDDTIDIEKIAKQVNYMEHNPSVDVLFTQWYEVDSALNTIVWREPKRAWFSCIEKYFFIKSMVLHASMMIKSDILRKYKYPSVNRAEDFILYLDLIKDGIIFDLLEEPLYYYYVERSNIELTLLKVHQFSKSYLCGLIANFSAYKYNPFFYVLLIKTSFEWLFTLNKFLYKNGYLLFKKILSKYIK